MKLRGGGGGIPASAYTDHVNWGAAILASHSAVANQLPRWRQFKSYLSWHEPKRGAQPLQRRALLYGEIFFVS